MSEPTTTEKTAAALTDAIAPKAKTPKPKKASARDMLRESGKVKKAKAAKGSRPKKERVPREDLVVFAFRLTKEQRDTIHTAAGPSKASQFVLNAALAAATKQK